MKIALFVSLIILLISALAVRIIASYNIVKKSNRLESTMFIFLGIAFISMIVFFLAIFDVF